MAKFLITYLGGNRPADAAQGKRHFAEYQQWLAALGEAAVSPANPLRNTHTVHADRSVTDGGGSAMSGYTIIQMESMEAALAAAKACPFLELGGALEVSELVEMPAA